MAKMFFNIGELSCQSNDRSIMEVKLTCHLRKYERQADQPTDQQTNKPTDGQTEARKASL